MIVKKLVKECLMKMILEKIKMSGVNSINWARIIAQSVYYFYAIFRLKKKNYKFFCSNRKFWRCLCRLSCKKNGSSNR